MKKIFNIALIVAFSFLISDTVVNASILTTPYNETTVSALSSAATSYITVSIDYTYVLHYVSNSSGSAVVHSYYQTYYDGQAVTVGTKLSLSESGQDNESVSWYPTGKSALSVSGYNIKSSTNCKGNNVSSSNCALEGEKYRLLLKNNNLFSDFSVSGEFIFYD